MKRIIMLIASLICLCSISMATEKNSKIMESKEKCCKTACNKETTPEIAGIRKALDAYTEAAVKGDSKIATPVFAETATMSFNENGRLVSVPIKVLFDYYDNDCPQEASYEISDISVADDAAIVRIESVFGGVKFSDMFTMVKDGDDWKIVSKIYHINP